jgi:exonuclease III
MLHHNIRSLNKNLHELDLILKTEIFDIVSLNETKLDDSFPISFYKDPIYIMVRRDKSRNEGGLLFMIKKDYKIIHQDIGESNEFKIDYIHLKIKIKNKILIL